jgi:glutathione-regulated potassium-efflux system ancillary protein KefG
MSRLIVVLAHPNLSESKVNKPLVDCATEVPGVTVHDLYDQYPDFKIDQEKEQKLIAGFDVIVLQHPLYWYSCPALLKEWLDKVFVRNFAYGRHGRALEGKSLVSVVSAGGPEATYTAGGSNEQSVQAFLKAFDVTAKFCGMQYATPLILHNAYRVSDDEMRRHRRAYSELLSSHARI